MTFIVEFGLHIEKTFPNCLDHTLLLIVDGNLKLLICNHYNGLTNKFLFDVLDNQGLHAQEWSDDVGTHLANALLRQTMEMEWTKI